MKGRNENYMKLVARLKEAGYELKRTNGSHFIYSNGKRTVSVPKNLNKCIMLRLQKEIQGA